MTFRMTFRRSTLAEYIAWLGSWLAAGNEPTRYYDYPWSRWTWLTAQADFTTGGECGAASAQIIVPPGIHHAGGALGHNTLYHAGTEAGLDGHGVPVFSDPEFTALPGVPDFILAKRAEALAADRQRAVRDAQDEEQRKSSDLSRWLRGRT